MAPDHFDPVKTELLPGINLIEASAGTGKTYTIAMLVLRFVVERNIPIHKLLVVTFTKAATEELKERVRLRLAEARRSLSGQTNGIDASVTAWLNGLALEPAEIRQRLNLALLDIDQAGIYTIHGFCQHVLSEHALESGQLLNAELLGDLTELRQTCADDFWRRQIYQRPLWEAAVLTADFKTPDALLASIGAIDAQASVVPSAQSLETALAGLKQAAEAANQVLDQCAQTLKTKFADNKFKVSYSDSFDSHLTALKDWLQNGKATMPNAEAFALLTGDGLKNALNGVRFKTNKNQTSGQRKADYLADLNINTGSFDILARRVKEIPLIMRKALLETLQQQLDKQLQRQNKLSFDSLITRLAEVLLSPESGHLLEQLRQRYETALIDEFQDTDENQWAIFSRIFSEPGHYLYLIGDPKQSIYQFRGADVYAYLNAQMQAQHCFTLGQNWRSHPQLVEAVNMLFHRQQAFLLDELTFHEISPALSADNGVLCKSNKPLAPMILWQLPSYDSDKGYWRSTDRNNAAHQIGIAVANEIIDLLSGAYVLQPANRRLQPKDIAILVRTNDQARDYQDQLRAAGVPSVLNSMESVFASPEAAALYHLLQALAQPGDSRFLKQALTLDWFALDGQSLYRLGNDEAEFDSWTLRFADYYQQWQDHGLMAMMQNLLAREKVEVTLSRSITAERQLTNLRHLIELVQQAAIDEHLGINKILDWLRLAIVKAQQNLGKAKAEEQQIRLESDEDAVQIVTMHRAKGLEYTVVFCPLLWQRSSRLKREKGFIKCHEHGKMIVDLGSDNFEERRAQALNEELAEDIRILYVAVTRAKYRCYLAWADVRSEQAENDSALAWLLEFAGTAFAAQQKKLQAFQKQDEKSFDYRLLTIPVEISGAYRKPSTAATFSEKQRTRQLYSHWQMSSYTALSALSLHETPELPEDKAGEQQTVDSEALESALPKGADTGNVVHELLETIAFTDLAERRDISILRDTACRRYGLTLERPSIIDELLHAVVATPLSTSDSSFCLMNVTEQRCLKEMPFYLAMQPMDASRINRILQDTSTYQPLSSKAMSGYLTGFIDLVCEYGGRYYVVDYKTNSLADYSIASLTQAMLEHNYGLQYWIYSLVLHLFLQQRLPAYDYDRHFGGVRYLFVRGMQPELPMSGIYQEKPDLPRLNALAQVFGGTI